VTDIKRQIDWGSLVGTKSLPTPNPLWDPPLDKPRTTMIDGVVRQEIVVRKGDKRCNHDWYIESSVNLDRSGVSDAKERICEDCPRIIRVWTEDSWIPYAKLGHLRR
jgi:hypothetical protein